MNGVIDLPDIITSSRWRRYRRTFHEERSRRVPLSIADVKQFDRVILYPESAIAKVLYVDLTDATCVIEMAGGDHFRVSVTTLGAYRSHYLVMRMPPSGHTQGGSFG